MTGLGAPDSSATSTSGGSNAYSADCVSTSNYLTAFNSAQTGTALTSLDGTLVLPSVIDSSRLIPCIAAADITHLYVGGVDVAGGLQYVGWVPGTIAGLYQMNIKMPDNTSGAFTTTAGLTSQSVVQPVQLPVQVVTASGHSQPGVSLWVAPRLIMVGPSSGTGAVANTVGGTVGVSLVSDSTNQVQASGGTGTVTYAVTSGLLPAGLSLSSSSGQISGVPAANTNGSYTVTVTATDSAPIPVTGTSTFVVTIAQGLFLSNSTPSVSTFGTANAGVSTVAASGGVSTYGYTIAITGHTLPAGLAIDPVTGIISTTDGDPGGFVPGQGHGHGFDQRHPADRIHYVHGGCPPETGGDNANRVQRRRLDFARRLQYDDHNRRLGYVYLLARRRQSGVCQCQLGVAELQQQHRRSYDRGWLRSDERLHGDRQRDRLNYTDQRNSGRHRIDHVLLRDRFVAQ